MAGKTNKEGTLPFIGVSEGFDLMNKIWGAAGLPTPASMVQFATQLPQTLPSMVAPTLDIEELDKRIAGLRAVEQWLNLNLSMLRTTVQSLEVQRNTIATLTSIGGTMLSRPAARAQAAEANWPYAVGQASPPMPVAPAVSPAPAPAPLPAAPMPAAAKRKRRSSAAPAQAPAVLPLNPTAWWNSLQDQFTRIAATAAAQAPAAPKGAASTEKSATKPAPAAAKKAPARKKRQD